MTLEHRPSDFAGVPGIMATVRDERFPEKYCRRAGDYVRYWMEKQPLERGHLPSLATLHETTRPSQRGLMKYARNQFNDRLEMLKEQLAENVINGLVLQQKNLMDGIAFTLAEIEREEKEAQAFFNSEPAPGTKQTQGGNERAKKNVAAQLLQMRRDLAKFTREASGEALLAEFLNAKGPTVVNAELNNYYGAGGAGAVNSFDELPDGAEEVGE